MAKAEEADSAARDFDAAEREFITALTMDRERPELARLAKAVADAGAAWKTAAYAYFFEARDVVKSDPDRIREAEIAAEIAEVIHSTWADLYQALSGNLPPPP